MKVLKERIGSSNVYIQALDDGLVVIGEASPGRATQVTGIEDDIESAYSKIRSTIKSLAEDMGTELRDIAHRTRPDKVELEFSLGISAEGKVVWVVSGKTEFGLKVTMSWDFSDNESLTNRNE
jgi:Trypsin-co-occurring domain 1